MSAYRPGIRRRHRRTPRGWIGRDGELTEHGEAMAEAAAEARDGRWDPPAEFDDPGPDGYGWAPDDMYPE